MGTLRIDRDICTGHGRCFDLAPDLVEPDDEGLGRVVVADIDDATQERALRVVRACPERAITLTEEREQP